MKTYLHNTPEGAEKEKKKVTAVSAVTAFFTTFMGSALNLSIPDIGKEFRADTFSLSWVVTIYLLACTALAVPFGKVADAVEKKFLLQVFSFSWFLLLQPQLPRDFLCSWRFVWYREPAQQ